MGLFKKFLESMWLLKMKEEATDEWWLAITLSKRLPNYYYIGGHMHPLALPTALPRISQSASKLLEHVAPNY
tara:strand:+ start:4938 stop:5153 length:216 start_codon:yes stop_codon:yes gene_type:complete